MNPIETRYEVFKHIEQCPDFAAAILNPPTPGEPVSITAVTDDGRTYRITFEETD